MNKLTRHLVAASITALGLSLANAGAGTAVSGLTRAEVREDLKDARAMNTMTPSGELGDTSEVLAAREAFNALQTEVFIAKNEQAERMAAANQALDELVNELQAADTDGDGVLMLISEDF